MTALSWLVAGSLTTVSRHATIQTGITQTPKRPPTGQRSKKCILFLPPRRIVPKKAFFSSYAKSGCIQRTAVPELTIEKRGMLKHQSIKPGRGPFSLPCISSTHNLKIEPGSPGSSTTIASKNSTPARTTHITSLPPSSLHQNGTK